MVGIIFQHVLMCLRLQRVPDTDVPATAVSLRATVLQMSLRGTRTADVPESDSSAKSHTLKPSRT